MKKNQFRYDRKKYGLKQGRTPNKPIQKTQEIAQENLSCPTSLKQFLEENFHLYAILGIFGAFIFYLYQVITSTSKNPLQGCCNSYVNTSITNVVNITNNVNLTNNLTTIFPHIQDGNNITNTANLTSNVSIILPYIQGQNSACMGNVNAPHSIVLFSNIFSFLKIQPEIILQYLLLFSCFFFVCISAIIIAQVFESWIKNSAPSCKWVRFQLLLFQSILIVMIFMALVYLWIQYSITALASISFLFSAIIMIGIALLFFNLFFSERGLLKIVLLTIVCLIVSWGIKILILDSQLNPTDEQNYADVLSSWFVIKFVALSIAYSSVFGAFFIMLSPFKEAIVQMRGKKQEKDVVDGIEMYQMEKKS